jgi:hypothetical protein
MGRSKIAFVSLIAISAIVTLSGCAKWFSKSSASAKHGTFFAVTAEKTPFYRYGPQQGGGPDRELTKDTLVTMIRHAFAYSKVRLPDGEQGFVANDDLSRASESLIAQANRTDASEDVDPLPPTPTVKLPTADTSPEFEPTPIPQPLMPP